MNPEGVVISGTGLFTPRESVSNAELVASFNTWVDRFNNDNAAEIAAGDIEAKSHSSVEFIEKASGIKSRFVVDKAGIIDPDRMVPRLRPRTNDEPSVMCEIGCAAAEQAIAVANVTADEIDAVIVAASNMERAYPAMAIEVQQALGIKGFAFDMNVACSSATFGINVASDMIKAGSAKRVLMVNPEICSGHLNFRDRDSHFIFGDVATAVIIEAQDTRQSDEAFEIISTKLFTQFSNNIRNNFGFLNRTAPEGIGATDKLFVQDGRRVFKEVLPLVVNLIETHITETGLKLEDIRRLWLHQANKNMNDYIGKKIFGRDPAPEEQPNVLQDFANTSSAGSMICFHKHHDNLQSQDMGVICSFGAGYSAGSIIVKKS